MAGILLNETNYSGGSGGGSITIDENLSLTSTNAVQNKTIMEAFSSIVTGINPTIAIESQEQQAIEAHTSGQYFYMKSYPGNYLLVAKALQSIEIGDSFVYDNNFVFIDILLNMIDNNSILELNNLIDVNVTSLQDGNILKYNANTSKWENAAGGSGTSDNGFIFKAWIDGGEITNYNDITETGLYYFDYSHTVDPSIFSLDNQPGIGNPHFLLVCNINDCIQQIAIHTVFSDIKMRQYSDNTETWTNWQTVNTYTSLTNMPSQDLNYYGYNYHNQNFTFSNAQNAPCDYGALFVINASPRTIQMVVGPDNIWTRYLYNGTWHNWVQMTKGHLLSDEESLYERRESGNLAMTVSVSNQSDDNTYITRSLTLDNINPNRLRARPTQLLGSVTISVNGADNPFCTPIGSTVTILAEVMPDVLPHDLTICFWIAEDPEDSSKSALFCKFGPRFRTTSTTVNLIAYFTVVSWS